MHERRKQAAKENEAEAHESSRMQQRVQNMRDFGWNPHPEVLGGVDGVGEEVLHLLPVLQERAESSEGAVFRGGPI